MLGLDEGSLLRILLGRDDGSNECMKLGLTLVTDEGCTDGMVLGSNDGIKLGNDDGFEEGTCDGILLGILLGVLLGSFVGSVVGSFVGSVVGCNNVNSSSPSFNFLIGSVFGMSPSSFFLSTS